MAQVSRPEDSSVEAVLSFHLHRGSENPTQILRPAQPASLPAEPSHWPLEPWPFGKP